MVFVNWENVAVLQASEASSAKKNSNLIVHLSSRKVMSQRTSHGVLVTTTEFAVLGYVRVSQGLQVKTVENVRYVRTIAV